MTEIREDLLDEALRLIDQGLGVMQHRELVSTNEVADLLLDVRLLLSAARPVVEESVAVGVGSA